MFNASRYFHTIRHLRAVQIYGRLWHKLHHPKPDIKASSAVRQSNGIWKTPARRLPSLIGPARLRFLNVEHEILKASSWNEDGWGKLWLYNLHYFDDLTAEKASERKAWHGPLITRWIAENPTGSGNGWEPYPLSLRIVNWIKWVLAGNELPEGAKESLNIQARFLADSIEYHLLGNHLLANAKALIFAGAFFEGEEAQAWGMKGFSILSRELPEQILLDGGHFELSPMYHSIILEDLLDIINLMQCYPDAMANWGDAAEARILVDVAKRMIEWLRAMCHPDGRIALFNDAAFGIAPEPDSLFEYAERLGIHEAEGKTTEQQESAVECFQLGQVRVIHLKASGYIRVENGPATAILDVAPIGPDYLPAHAHADTLSFELSLNGQRLIVDGGTSRYDESAERLKERGTDFHNTVAIDDKDSSEVWGSFRVARRARPFGLEIKGMPDGALMVRCAHDGYRRLEGRPIHWREWQFNENSMAVHDVIENRYCEAVSRFHFHPDTALEKLDDGQFSILMLNGSRISCRVLNGIGRLVNSAYHPGFGSTCRNQCLEVTLERNSSHVVFDWT
jgi:uncharacterized heparinase superfamily protein